mmetsp:Transcript_35356/g.63788  ORF Transcript_35356/g.63788 Transcript_35356/m.63788 type:complete len:327 (-) Transcript_35356:2407-3387(-)
MRVIEPTNLLWPLLQVFLLGHEVVDIVREAEDEGILLLNPLPLLLCLCGEQGRLLASRFYLTLQRPLIHELFLELRLELMQVLMQLFDQVILWLKLLCDFGEPLVKHVLELLQRLHLHFVALNADLLVPQRGVAVAALVLETGQRPLQLLGLLPKTLQRSHRLLLFLLDVRTVLFHHLQASQQGLLLFAQLPLDRLLLIQGLSSPLPQSGDLEVVLISPTLEKDLEAVLHECEEVLVLLQIQVSFCQHTLKFSLCASLRVVQPLLQLLELHLDLRLELLTVQLQHHHTVGFVADLPLIKVLELLGSLSVRALHRLHDALALALLRI